MDPQILAATIAGVATIAGTLVGAQHLWTKKKTAQQAQPVNAEVLAPDWSNALLMAEKVLVQIEGGDWKPDLILGLGRSGAIWGGWFAGNLGSLPIAVVDILYRKTPVGRDVTFPAGAETLQLLREVRGSTLKVLIVQGASSTGQTFMEFLGQHRQHITDWSMKFAVLYRNRAVATRIDFVGKNLDPWPKRLPWHLRPVYRPEMNGVSDQNE